MTSVNAELFHREQDRYLEALRKKPCTCVSCQMCNGNGNLSDPFDYIGDGLTTCDDCEGSGITEVCDRCYELQENE